MDLLMHIAEREAKSRRNKATPACPRDQAHKNPTDASTVSKTHSALSQEEDKI